MLVGEPSSGPSPCDQADFLAACRLIHSENSVGLLANTRKENTRTHDTHTLDHTGDVECLSMRFEATV